MYFEEKIVDQDRGASFEVEIGRSSYYANCSTESGMGEDSVYLTVDGKNVIMSRMQAKKFIEAVVAVGRYHNMID